MSDEVTSMSAIRNGVEGRWEWFGPDEKAELERLRKENRQLRTRFASERILGDEETQLDTERKLRMRIGGLTKAVGEMEPGEREFCLAAIDEWLDYMVALRAELERLRSRLEFEQQRWSEEKA